MITVKEEAVNLRAGQATKLTVTSEQEENYDGDIAFFLEGLPAGVTSVPGARVVPETAPPFPEEHRERFLPRKQETTIVLIADAGAAATAVPHDIEILARPIVKGQPGPVISVHKFPLMVVAPPAPQKSPGGLGPHAAK
jgi:hypothetical protein